MLLSLELENFKGFGNRVRIPLAPITLIFGENSSGKSSILQSLSLLKQTIDSRAEDVALLPRSERGTVDLGSFQELLFDHDLNRKLHIKIEASSAWKQNAKKHLDKGTTESNAIEWIFKRTSARSEVEIESIELYSQFYNSLIARFVLKNVKKSSKGAAVVKGHLKDRRSNPRRVRANCEWVTNDQSYWQDVFQWVTEHKDAIVKTLKEIFTHFKAVTGTKRIYWPFDNLEIKDFEEGIAFYSSNFTIEDFIKRVESEQYKTFVELRGLLVQGYPNQFEYFDRLITVLGSYPLYVTSHEYRKKSSVSSLLSEASKTIEKNLNALLPMGPYREPPQRWYLFTGTTPSDVGYRGNFMPDLLYRDKKLVINVNKWLAKLNIGYKIQLKSISSVTRDLFEVRLIDTRRANAVDVGLPDVGYGISQLLPFIVQSLLQESRIITIEQPEVHIHPRLQAEVGDLLAEAIKKEAPNQFIVETHSEHLILRLQKLIRKKKLKPQDISVIYVSREKLGTKVNRLELNSRGEFVDDWPGGFFLERLKEL